MIRAVIFDFGHTIVDELQYSEVPLRTRPVRLMPGVLETLPMVHINKGIWANTKRATQYGVRDWLRCGNIDSHFKWVVTSVDAGYRKPDKRFFDYALNKCGLSKEEVLFVGNQLNTDIKGAVDYGIQNVWLTGEEHRSPDDTFSLIEVRPTYVITRLQELPALLDRLKIL